MDLTENLNLIGYSMTENKQLKSIDEVAEFICKNGKHGDVTITNNGEPFITTIYEPQEPITILIFPDILVFLRKFVYVNFCV